MNIVDFTVCMGYFNILFKFVYDFRICMSKLVVDVVGYFRLPTVFDRVTDVFPSDEDVIYGVTVILWWYFYQIILNSYNC